MFRLMEKLVDRRLLAALVLAIGFAASFLAAYDVPTVGASAMVYAMTGMFLSMANLCRDIRIIDKRKFARFILAILACLIVGAAKGNGNFFLHLFAMMIGGIAGAGIAAFRNR
jgi:membrane associated rhomboid family serine protease